MNTNTSNSEINKKCSKITRKAEVTEQQFASDEDVTTVSNILIERNKVAYDILSK